MTTAMFAVAAVRAWTRLYTSLLAPDVRTRRRAEVASDLWESQQDSARGLPLAAGHILVRLLLGAPDDLRWRIEQVEWPANTERTVALAAIAALAIWWALESTTLSRAPRPREMQIFLGAPPPPPPAGVDAGLRRHSGSSWARVDHGPSRVAALSGALR